MEGYKYRIRRMHYHIINIGGSMPKKNRLKLDSLKVQSFVTALGREAANVKGGSTTNMETTVINPPADTDPGAASGVVCQGTDSCDCNPPWTETCIMPCPGTEQQFVCA